MSRVKLGAEVLFERRLDLIRGKRVGLITNPTGVDSALGNIVDRFRSDSAINLVALGISSVVIAFTYYVIGAHSPFALNVAKFVGIGIGTVFRFWSYKRYVFPAHPQPVGAGATAVD